MIYLVEGQFFSDRPQIALVNPPVNSAGGTETSHIIERIVGNDIIELVPVSNNFNFGPADIEILAGEKYIGNIFYNCAYGNVLEGYLSDYPSDQIWSWIWCRDGVPDIKKVRRRIEDRLRKSSDSDIFRVAIIVGIKTH